MFDMRVEEHRDAGAAAVWHVVGKGSTSVWACGLCRRPRRLPDCFG